MSRRVIILNFKHTSLSYQVFSEIKQLHMKREIKGEQMAVVTHQGDGTHQFEIKDFVDFTGKDKTSKNSFIGLMVGLLAGYPGMLIGWFAGSMIGGAQDAKEITTANGIFEHVANQIREGETGVVLIAEEKDNRPLNELVMMKHGGYIQRLDFTEVEAEIKNAAEKLRTSQTDQPSK